MKKVLSLILVVAMIAAMGIVTASAAGTRTAYDICYLSSSTAKAMPITGTGTDDFGDITAQIDGNDAGLVFFGWHCSDDEIEAFGYSINGGDISWTGSVGPTTDDVVSAGMGVPGTVDVERFTVVVPFTQGDDNVVEIYCKSASDEYVFWTATYACSLDFSVMKEINFDAESDMADFADTTSSPLISDTNFASFISANYKIADGALVLKKYADIRWWGLNLVPTADYVAAEYEFSAEKLVALTYFSVNDANDASQATSNQGDGGKLILVGPGEEGKLNVYDNQYAHVATIDANKTYKLTAILEVGTQNYYIAIDGVRLDVTCEYPVEFTAVGGMRVDVQANKDVEDVSVVTYDNIIVKNCELTDYPKEGEPAPSEKPSQTPTQKPSDTTTQQPSGGDNTVDTADNTAIVFMIAAAAFVVTVLLKKRAY